MSGAYRGITFVNDFAPANVPVPVPTTVPAPRTGGGLIDLAGDVIGGILTGGLQRLTDYQFGQGGLVESGSIKLVPGGQAGVQKKYRHMNVCNARALRRSMRRVQGFARFAKKTISFTQRVKMRKRKR